MVSDCYLPRLGGIELQVADLARHHADAGDHVVVLTATPGPDQPGVVRLLPPVPLPVPVNPWAGPDLARLLAGADVVHVHLGIVAPFAAMAARTALRLGRPTVVTWHSMLGPATPALRYAAPWRRWVAAGAVPTAVSRAAARQVEAALGDRHEVAVLPNGIEAADWVAPGPPPADGPLRVMTAIRFARRKRPLAVVTTVRRLRERLPGVDLEVEIAGDGPLLPPLRRLVEREGLGGWLHLPGRLSRAELARRYHRSHLYLSPARLESFGIAALEARTAGLPVAGLTGSGLTEFVTDGVSGVLADNDDQLLERVAGLLADRDRLARMAEHNRTHLPEQVWPAVVRRTREVYERARVEHAAAARD